MDVQLSPNVEILPITLNNSVIVMTNIIGYLEAYSSRLTKDNDELYGSTRRQQKKIN